MRPIRFVFLVLMLALLPMTAQAEKEPSKALKFFYRTGLKIDKYLLTGVDTNYITLPEHCWKLALNNGESGVNAAYRIWLDVGTPADLMMRNKPSIQIGFNAGYRGIGFGYSWDVLSAYSTNWNISLGGKGLGISFRRQVTTNLTGKVLINEKEDPDPTLIDKGDMRIATTSLSAWYALNASHYSHNAAIKQSYIQRKPAGSILLSLAYMSYEIGVQDSSKFVQDEDMHYLINGMTKMITRQVAVGVGYGINYTPNHGKVLLHAAAFMQVVCYSVNHVSYILPDSVYLPGEPQYVIHPYKPVHVTGNMRAAVSWEINEWVHLSAWAQAEHLSFEAVDQQLSAFKIRSWNWQANLTIGVRIGAGTKRVRKALGDEEYNTLRTVPQPHHGKLPKWLREYFFSSSL